MPISLSLEMHCSLPQQARCAELMREYLSNIPYTTADGLTRIGGLLLPDELPPTMLTPDGLRGKVIVKGKCSSVATHDARPAGGQEAGSRVGQQALAIAVAARLVCSLAARRTQVAQNAWEPAGRGARVGARSH